MLTSSPDLTEDDEPSTTPSPRRAAHRPRPRWGISGRTVALHGAVIAGFLFLSIVMWWHVWITGNPTSTVVCRCGDISEELGYLAWTPYAIAHLHNPLLSHAIYAGQGGVNMLANTSNLALGTLLAPVTWLFGPIATFNVAVTLAPVVSGWTFFVVARRFTRFVPGQIAAAAFYGFSPTVVSSVTVGHFFLAWMFFPPLAFLLLYELVAARRFRAVTVGVLLGLLVVVQFFTGTELLAMAGVIGAVGLVTAAAVAPRRAWTERRRIATGLGAAVVTAGVLLAYPLWFLVDGPQRVVGIAWPGTQRFGSHLGAIVTAGPGVTHVSPLLRLSGYFGPTGPDVVFLGWGVLAFLAVSVVVWHRQRLAWVVVVTGAVSWWLSLGPHQKRDGQNVGWWTPDRLLAHIPLVNQIIPPRFSAVTGLAVALLLAISADRWWRVGQQWLARRRTAAPADRTRSLSPGWAVVLAVAVVGALVPVATSYRFPLVIEGGTVPRWFTTSATRLTPGTVVLTAPYPSSGLPEAMGWQAEDDLRFRLVSGYAIVPGGDGRHSAARSPLGGTDTIFDELSFGLAGPEPDGAPAQLAEVRNTMRRWGVRVVVVTSVGRDPAYAVGYFTAALGRPPRREEGAWVWYGLGTAPPLRMPAGTLAACDPPGAGTSPLAVSGCVLEAAAGSALT